MRNIKYLLLGGGYTLTELAKNLLPSEFIISARTDEKAAAFRQAGYISERLDLKDSFTAKELFKKYPGIEVIVDSIPPLNEENTELIKFTDDIKKTSVKRIIYFSTTGVFGVNDGSWVNEESAPAPNNSKSLARYSAEKIYSNLNLDFCAFRIAAIYGPGRGVGVALKNGTYHMLEDGSRWSNRIHVLDIVEACKTALSKSYSEKLPPVLCLSDCRPSKISEIVEFYCKKFGYPLPKSVSTAEALMRGMHSLVSNQRVDNKLLISFLGKNLLYPSYIEGAEAS